MRPLPDWTVTLGLGAWAIAVTSAQNDQHAVVWSRSPAAATGLFAPSPTVRATSKLTPMAHRDRRRTTSGDLPRQGVRRDQRHSDRLQQRRTARHLCCGRLGVPDSQLAAAGQQRRDLHRRHRQAGLLGGQHRTHQPRGRTMTTTGGSMCSSATNDPSAVVPQPRRRHVRGRHAKPASRAALTKGAPGATSTTTATPTSTCRTCPPRTSCSGTTATARSRSGARLGVDQPLMSFPTWFFDYDNDGWLDLFVAS